MWHLEGQAHFDGVEGQLLHAIHEGILALLLDGHNLKHKTAVPVRVREAAALRRRCLQAHQRVQRLFTHLISYSHYALFLPKEARCICRRAAGKASQGPTPCWTHFTARI